MINLADYEAEKIVSKNSELHTSRKESVTLTKIFWGNSNFKLGNRNDPNVKEDMMNWAFPISAQTLGSESTIIKVIAHTVRDTDLDFFTQQIYKVYLLNKKKNYLSTFIQSTWIMFTKIYIQKLKPK